MNISQIRLITFSPTSTSRKVGEAIAVGTAIPTFEITELTLGGSPMPEISADTLTIVTVPVYAGHVAPLAMQRLAELRSKGGAAVPVVVYGNRDYEKALIELGDFLTERGFRLIAAATFIGEHSYSTADKPIAAGRPDASDLARARSFGESIRKKIEAAEDIAGLDSVNVARIPRPRQPLIPQLRFVYNVIKLRKSRVAKPRTPEVDAQLCTHCGYCASICPSGAIAKGNECSSDSKKCIRCCACVKQCPRHARTFNTPFAALLFNCFKQRREPGFST